MEIINDAIRRDLTWGTPLNLNLGSGDKPRAGFYSVDFLPLPGIDMVADLNQPLVLLPDNSVGAIYTRHTLEHVQNFLPLMRELHRVVRPDGTIEIIVPHFSNPYHYSDPTHVRFFGMYTMFYFGAPDKPTPRTVPTFYVDYRFRVASIRIRFYRRSLFDKVTATLLSPVINRNYHLLDFYERRLCRLFHASEIAYVMSPEK